MSYTSNQINSQSLNGIINLTDGVLNIEDGIISNIQQLNVIGNSELDGDLIVDGKITCAYNALLPSDVVNKNYVDDALNNNSRFLRVDGTNKMNADLNVGNKYIYNLLDPSGNQDATTKYYTDTADNLRLLKSGGTMTGILDMSGNSITNLLAGVYNTDAVNKLQMDNADNLRLLKSGGTMSGILDMSGNRIIKLATGIDDTDGINKLQMDNADNLRLLKSGGTMSGNLDMSGNRIIKLATGIDNTDGINKLQMDNADNLRLKLDGTNAMTNNLNMNSKLINLVGDGVLSTDGVNKLQMDNADNLRLKLDGSSAMTGALNMNSFSINNCPNFTAGTSTTFKIGTTTVMTTQVNQLLMSLPINMGGKSLSNLAYPTSNISDATNKNYVDTEDNKRLKIDGSSAMSGDLNMNSKNITNLNAISSASHIYNIIGGQNIIDVGALNIQFNKYINIMAVDTGILMNNTSIELCKSINGFTNSNLLINYYTGTANLVKLTITSGKTLITDGLKISNVGIDMSGNTITNLSNAISALDAVNKSQLDLKLNLTGGTLSNTLTFSGGGIDMSGYDLAKVSNINSNGTNALNLQHNSITKIKVDSLGLTMQNSANLDMNNGTISNATLTTPKITAPIQTTASSIYSNINNSYLNIGYTTTFAYSATIPMTKLTYYALLGVNNKLTIYAGVWIITASFNPSCFSGTPDSQAIQMIVNNVNASTTWSLYPASKVRHILNGNYDSNDSGYIVNTFVITLTAQTDLYLWGKVDYTGSSIAWQYDFAELRASRIA